MKSVLVLDRYPSIVQILSVALSMDGFNVYSPNVLENGFSYAAVFKTIAPKVVIMDVPFPYEENLKRFKDLSKLHPESYFIIVTTFPEKVQCLLEKEENSSFVVVGKPFNLEKLSLVVREGFKRFEKQAMQNSLSKQKAYEKAN